MRERRANRITYRGGTVAARNDDRSLAGELSLGKTEVHRFFDRRQPSTDGLEVGGTGRFHLDLHLAVARVDVIELLLPRRARVEQEVVVEEFVYMDKFSQPRESENELVHTGIAVLLPVAGDCLPEGVRADQDDAAEVEVVPQRALLPVDYGMRLD